MRTRGARGLWPVFWMRLAGPGPLGRLATRLATLGAPPYKARIFLAGLNRRGYVSADATVHHSDLRLGAHIFIDDQVTVFQSGDPSAVEIGDHSRILRHTLLETGPGGSIVIGSDTWIMPGCQLVSYEAPIRIGSNVQIAQNCAFYSYDHRIRPGELIAKQKLQTKGPILIGDDVWIGTGAIVLSGVRIGTGAVVGAGALVNRDVPDDAIVVGVPARVVGTRTQAMREDGSE